MEEIAQSLTTPSESALVTFKAKSWNYVVALIACCSAAIFSGVATIEFVLMHLSVLGAVLMMTLCVILTLGSYHMVRRIIWPPTIQLSLEGIVSTNGGRRDVIPWDSYNGIRGGAVPIIDYSSASGERRSLATGLWRINLEVVIYEYATGLGYNVPIRPIAREQASLWPGVIVAILLLLFVAIKILRAYFGL